MTTVMQKALPSRNSGSQAAVSELPIVQWSNKLLVDARLLHQKLQSKQDFSDWIKKRLADYGFSDKEDFTINLRKSTGGRKAIDYLLTLDTAKEIAMLERNEIGRMIRRYFIQKEKEARGEYFLLPREKMEQLFAGMKPLNINGRTMYPFRKTMMALGYRNIGGNQYYYCKNYPNHFIDFDDMRYISQELALQVYHGKLVRLSRTVNKKMAPVLPQNFADPKELKGGNHE